MLVVNLFLLFQLIQANLIDMSAPYLEEKANVNSNSCYYDSDCKLGCCNSGSCDSECCRSNAQCETNCCMDGVCLPSYECTQTCNQNSDCGTGCCQNSKCASWTPFCCNRGRPCPVTPGTSMCHECVSSYQIL